MIVAAGTDEPSIVFQPHDRLNRTHMPLKDLVDSLILPESEDLNATFVVVERI